jgi:hypothetical protein
MLSCVKHAVGACGGGVRTYYMDTNLTRLTGLLAMLRQSSSLIALNSNLKAIVSERD